MKTLYIATVLTSAWMSVGAVAQEHRHDERKEEKPAPVTKAAEPAKSEFIKCCEGMEKMGAMKAGMPMKTEMKAKMMEEMKQKMAEKAQEKKASDLPAKSQTEKSPANMDGHQH